MFEIRKCDLARDLPAVRSLWLDYLGWGNDEMEARHGFRLPVHEAVERDVANIGKFEPPDGRIVLAFEEDTAVGIACLQRIGPGAAHALYRSSGFVDTGPYAESEIPDEYRKHWVFMEKVL